MEEKSIKTNRNKIKKERKRLATLIEDEDDYVKNMLVVTLDNLAYLRVKIESLGEHVLLHGVTEEYQNGANQWGKKMSSEYEAYIQSVKLYIASLKQMKDFLPKEKKREIDESLMNFINNRPV